MSVQTKLNFAGDRVDRRERSTLLLEILEIKDYRDLKNLGNLIDEFKYTDKQVPITIFLENNKLTPIQILALCIVAPVQVEPEIIYRLLRENVNHFSDCGKSFYTGLAMRLVAYACMSNNGEKLYEDNIIQDLVQKSPEYFTCALLFLTAQIQRPIEVDPHFTKDIRCYAMSLYYHGINMLLLHKYKDAENSFSHALLFSKGCKDIRTSLIDKLSLASFLNRTPKSVFYSRLNEKYYPVYGCSAEIWEITCPLSTEHFSTFYDVFVDDIMREYSRRVILHFSVNVTKITITKLSEKCSGSNVEEILDELRKLGEIQYEINDGVVIFQDIILTNKIDTQIQEVTSLMQLAQTPI